MVCDDERQWRLPTLTWLLFLVALAPHTAAAWHASRPCRHQPLPLPPPFVLPESSRSFSGRRCIRSPRIHAIRSSRRQKISSRLQSSFDHVATSNFEARQGIEMPLLDLVDSDDDYRMIQPLPSAHLPDELSTQHIYGMQVTRPAHQMVVDHAMENRAVVSAEDALFGAAQSEPPLFGHVAYKPCDSLVGAIGCAAQVLLNAPNQDLDLQETTAGIVSTDAEQGMAPAKTVLCRGSFRFVVREIVKSIPYPVAIVDELLDDPVDATRTPASGKEEDDDEYADLTPSELSQRTLQAMHELTKQQLAAAGEEKELSPLEQAILEDAQPGQQVAMNDAAAKRLAAEEMAAVFDVFQSSLIDLCPLPNQDRYFTIAMLAAEMANLDNPSRIACLKTTDSIERLRMVLEELEEQVGMAKARKMAAQITDASDESQKDLQVGQPTLPPWSKQITKGTNLEYYWNEEYGWCKGEVIDDPVLIVDELLITVFFPDDGETHTLPFSADEKVRWRPAQ